MSKPHSHEPHASNWITRLGWLRAGVLGANDGIVSTAGIVIGVAGAGSSSQATFIAGVAGLTAGAFSMAAGEYVSVSSQRDSEQALIKLEKDELERFPEEELRELAGLYEAKGLEPQTARDVAEQLTSKNALGAHAEIELGFSLDELASPWRAALASSVSFVVGALLPLLAITSAINIRVGVTVAAVVLALTITGYLSAKLGRSNVARQIVRNVVGGCLAMAATYTIGYLLGVHVL